MQALFTLLQVQSELCNPSPDLLARKISFDMNKKMTANIIMTYANKVPVNLQQPLHHSMYDCSCLKKLKSRKETGGYKQAGDDFCNTDVLRFSSCSFC